MKTFLKTTLVIFYIAVLQVGFGQALPQALQSQGIPTNMPAILQAQPQPEPESTISRVDIFPEINKDAGKIGIPFWEKHWLSIVLASVVVLIILSLVLLRKKKVPTKTPYEIAMESISDAEMKSISLEANEYAALVSGAVREYIEAQHNIPAPERTTQEFLIIASNSEEFSDKAREILSQILNLSDMAKFARKDFNSAQRIELVNASKAFLNADIAEKKGDGK